MRLGLSGIGACASLLLLAASLAACAQESSGAPMPTSLAEANQLAAEQTVRVVRCMEERGWDVGWNDDGTPSGVSGPREQADQMMKDSAECRAKAGAENPLPTTLPQNVQQEFYQARVDQLHCVSDLGYPLPDIPSFENVQQGVDMPTTADMIPEDVLRTRGHEIEQKCPSPWSR